MRPAPLAILLSIAACGDASSDSNGGPAVTPPPAACEADQRAAPDGTCELFASPAGCPAGTRPAIGAETCASVGPTSCAPGFERDPSGWGCAAVLPAASCTGATRPRLGERDCAPVGDCAGAYPPAGAIIVDPALADGALDATHVRTVADALALAADGSTIALVDGDHTAAPFIVSKAVALVGRCAAKTRLAAAQAGAASGISVRANASVRGLTLDGYTDALTMTGAIEAKLEDIVIEKARSRAVFAKQGAKVKILRSVVRGTSPIGTNDQTIAIFAGTSGVIEVEDSAVLSSIDAAVAATDNVNTRITLTRSVVQDTKPRADRTGGSAVRAFEGAHVDVVESAILRATGMAVLTFRRNAPPPQVTLTRSVIRGTVASLETGTAIGTAINAAYEAVVRIDETTIADSEGTALYAAEKAKIAFTKSVINGVHRSPDLSAHGGTALKDGVLILEDSAVVGVGGLGVGAWDKGHVTIGRSLIREIGGDVVDGVPTGQGLNANITSSIEAIDSAIVDAREVGVSGAKPGTTIRLERVLITHSDGAPASMYGHGVLAVDSASITMLRSIVEKNTSVGLFFAAAGGVASASTIRDNAVAVHVQDGSTLTEVDTAPEVVPEGELVITKDTRFTGNATRVGSGVLPLPAPLASP